MLTEEEKIILKNTDKKWRYIARDKGGGLKMFFIKPTKLQYEWRHWWWHDFEAFNHLFQDVKWTDNEPLEFRNEKGEFLL